ncbi:hypothetical protein BPORC_1808 [Bifidobacterium porcinum]|nr:hypothetical protein BPORC_1808 [Bifidobacterium porcinum]
MAREVLQSGEMHDCRHRGSAPYRCRLLHGPRAAERPRLDSMSRRSHTGAVPETTEPHAGKIPHSIGDYGEIGHPEIISQANPGVLQRDVCSGMISRTAMAEFRGSAIQPQTPIREVTVRQSRIRQTPGETGRLRRKNQAWKNSHTSTGIAPIQLAVRQSPGLSFGTAIPAQSVRVPDV